MYGTMPTRLCIVVWAFLGAVLCPVLSSNAPVTLQSISDECSNGVAYRGLGCFTLEEPFSNTDWLPQSPDTIGLRFRLYTRANPTSADILHFGSRSSIYASHFNGQLPVKLIVHGFLQNAGMEYLADMTSALLNKTAMNVIVVNWGDGAGFPYARAVANTRVVGAAMARLIGNMLAMEGTTARQVHIIGHSLGAHAAGYTGAVIPDLGRITGLDPAQPRFSGFDETVRLDPTDARFVDVIHTDALPYDTVRGYGIIEPIGHVDFYPNGGHDQTGCYEDSSVLGFVGDVVENGLTTAETGLTCNHERSRELFTSSILLSSTESSCSFLAYPCQSEDSFMRGECLNCGNRPCPIMGFDASGSFGSRGVFYLKTTGSSPFCGHHYFVTLNISDNMPFMEGNVSVRLRGTEARQLAWKSIKEGGISGGDRISQLLIDETDIGEITQVLVWFQPRGSELSWSASSQPVKFVEVDSVMKFPRKHFCPTSGDLFNGRYITLTYGSYSSSDCP
ncbi:hypothetical protein BsWGS_19455 [Bradybaena similaris]